MNINFNNSPREDFSSNSQSVSSRMTLQPVVNTTQRVAQTTFSGGMAHEGEQAWDLNGRPTHSAELSGDQVAFFDFVERNFFLHSAKSKKYNHFKQLVLHFFCVNPLAIKKEDVLEAIRIIEEVQTENDLPFSNFIETAFITSIIGKASTKFNFSIPQLILNSNLKKQKKNKLLFTLFYSKKKESKKENKKIELFKKNINFLIENNLIKKPDFNNFTFYLRKNISSKTFLISLLSFFKEKKQIDFIYKTRKFLLSFFIEKELELDRVLDNDLVIPEKKVREKIKDFILILKNKENINLDGLFETSKNLINNLSLFDEDVKFSIIKKILHLFSDFELKEEQKIFFAKFIKYIFQSKKLYFKKSIKYILCFSFLIKKNYTDQEMEKITGIKTCNPIEILKKHTSKRDTLCGIFFLIEKRRNYLHLLNVINTKYIINIRNAIVNSLHNDSSKNNDFYYKNVFNKIFSLINQDIFLWKPFIQKSLEFNDTTVFEAIWEEQKKNYMGEDAPKIFNFSLLKLLISHYLEKESRGYEQAKRLFLEIPCGPLFGSPKKCAQFLYLFSTKKSLEEMEEIFDHILAHQSDINKADLMNLLEQCKPTQTLAITEEEITLPSSDQTQTVQPPVIQIEPISSTILTSDDILLTDVYRVALEHCFFLENYLMRFGGDFKVDLADSHLGGLKKSLIDLSKKNPEQAKTLFFDLGFYDSKDVTNQLFFNTCRKPQNEKKIPYAIFQKIVPFFLKDYFRCFQCLIEQQEMVNEGFYYSFLEKNQCFRVNFSINKEVVLRLSLDPLPSASHFHVDSVQNADLLFNQHLDSIFAVSPSSPVLKLLENCSPNTSRNCSSSSSSSSIVFSREKGSPDHLLSSGEKRGERPFLTTEPTPPKKRPKTQTPQEISFRLFSKQTAIDFQRQEAIFTQKQNQKRSNEPLSQLTPDILSFIFSKTSVQKYIDLKEMLSTEKTNSIPSSALYQKHMMDLLLLHWSIGSPVVFLLSPGDRLNFEKQLKKIGKKIRENSLLGIISLLHHYHYKNDHFLSSCISGYIKNQRIPLGYRAGLYGYATQYIQLNVRIFPSEERNLLTPEFLETQKSNFFQKLRYLENLGFSPKPFRRYVMKMDENIGEDFPSVLLIEGQKKANKAAFLRALQEKKRKPITIFAPVTEGEAFWKTLNECGKQNFRWVLLSGLNTEKAWIKQIDNEGLEPLVLRAEHLIKCLDAQHQKGKEQKEEFKELVQIVHAINDWMHCLPFSQRSHVLEKRLYEIPGKTSEGAVFMTQNEKNAEISDHLKTSGSRWQRLLLPFLKEKKTIVYLTGVQINEKNGMRHYHQEIASIFNTFQKNIALSLQREFRKNPQQNAITQQELNAWVSYLKRDNCFRILHKKSSDQERIVNRGDHVVCSSKMLPLGLDVGLLLLDPSFSETQFSLSAFKKVEKLAVLHFSKKQDERGLGLEEIFNSYFGQSDIHSIEKNLKQFFRKRWQLETLDRTSFRPTDLYPFILSDATLFPFSPSLETSLPMEDIDGEPIQLKDYPLYLRNRSNNCYLNSALQCLNACSWFASQIKDFPLSGEAQKFYEVLQKILAGEQGLEEELLQELFKSGLDPEFLPLSKGRQLDAESVMRTLSRLFLPQSIIQIDRSTTTTYREQELIEKETGNQLGLDFPDSIDNSSPQSFLLSDLIKKKFKSVSVNDEKNLWRGHAQYSMKETLKNTPTVLNIHLKRFKISHRGETQKIETPILLEDGCIYMSDGRLITKDIYQKLKADPRVIGYEIKGYIVHAGGMNGGHYTAYVKKNEKYYFCDDTAQDKYTEITKEQFLGNTQAYYLMLEKMEK